MLTKDRKKLYSLLSYPFDRCKRAADRVDRFCTVRFDTNNYSVPAAYCGREISVKAGPETIPIYFDCLAPVVSEQKAEYLHAETLPSLAEEEMQGYFLRETGTRNTA